jgi:hypothetical protein
LPVPRRLSFIFATMKRSYFFAILFLLIASVNARAQHNKPTVGCIDRSIRLQADEIKQHYTNQGFVVFRDAMLNMESMSPSPVMVEMKKGELYQIIFVGSLEAVRMNLTLFDGNENKLEDRFVYKNRQQPNYIIIPFSPERTDTYLIGLMQKWKNKDMCGSLCILRMGSDKQNVTVTPYQ